MPLSAKIFDIQRASMVDGPGIRTTVFFWGCNLRCQWCHNPEGLGLDISVPPKYKAHEYTVSDLADIVAEDTPFYDNDGGVTCSGGECMLQIDFLADFLAECKKRGINTAVDTAGNVPSEYFKRIIPFTDLFLYDIKCITPNNHKRFTGVDNSLILRNLRMLFEMGTSVIIRVPIIPEFNCNKREILKIKDFLSPYNPSSVEFLPYHTMGIGKYKALGLEYREFREPDAATMNRIKSFYFGNP